MKIIKKYVFLSLCAFLVFCFIGTANAGRETLDNPPQQINWQSGDSPWAFRIEDGRSREGGYPSGTRRYEIKPTGDVAIFDSSGVTRVNLKPDGSIHTFNASGIKESIGNQIIKNPLIVDLAGTSVYTVAFTNSSELWIDDHESQAGTQIASGVSIMLPKITEAYDGYEVKIQKMTSIADIDTTAGVTGFSGTTIIVVSTVPWVSGTTDHIWNATTGVTNESSDLVPGEVTEIDAVGDYLIFKAMYGPSGSTWYQVGRYIQ